MVYDINSPSESTRIISKLMQWTDDRQIHIHTILHQNKGDEERKRAYRYGVEQQGGNRIAGRKDKGNGDISHVSAIHIRAMDFEPSHSVSTTKPFPNSLRDTNLKQRSWKTRRREVLTLTGISPNSSTVSHWKPFSSWRGIRLQGTGRCLNQDLYVSGCKAEPSKAVSLITMLRNKRMIVQETGRKYTFMPDFHY